jgi:hypothetical protein
MRKQSARALLSLFVILGIAASLAMPGVAAQNRDKPSHHSARESYTGTVVAIGGQFGGASRTFTLEITGHTPTEEGIRLFEILRTQGQDGFMKAITSKELGHFSVDGQVGRDLNFVQESQSPKGRKITIIFERWLRMFEVRNATRSRDYPFTYIELFVDDNGKGEGSLVGLAKLSADKQNPNTFDIENFGTYAAKLMGVELRSR